MEKVWFIRNSARRTPSGNLWGDTFFADALRHAFAMQGDLAVEFRSDEDPPLLPSESRVINLALLGLHNPKAVPGALNIAWVISHPELISQESVEHYDLICTSSPTYSKLLASQIGREIHTVLQAADTRFFFPVDRPSVPIYDAVFVGQRNNRRQRPMIDWALGTNLKLKVYGPGWREHLPSDVYGGDFLDYSKLPRLYEQSRFVLADHWPEMAALGFVQNRIFDALAGGHRVICDNVKGIQDLGLSGVSVVDSKEELERLVVSQTSQLQTGSGERARIVANQHSFHSRALQLKNLVDSHWS